MNDGRIATRIFAVAWIVLGLAGALNHTIAESVLGRRFDLVLPQLRYGYVMFNSNLRTAQVYEYAGADGVRHDLADLVQTPAPGYARARLALDVLIKKDYLAEVCLRAWRARHEELDFFVTEYAVDAGSNRQTRAIALRCGANGLVGK